MKTLGIVSMLGCVGLFLLTSCTGEGNPPLEGRWEGLFMEEFRTVLNFEAGKSGKAFVLMYDGQQEIQNDELSQVKLAGSKLSFFIEAKETHFKGTLNDDHSEISGIFVFPDGSEHPFKAKQARD